MEDKMDFESKLVPVLREGVDVIKMILFKKLKEYLSEKYSDQESSYINKLSGAMINELFGTENIQEPFVTFIKKNKSYINKEMKNIAIELSELRIPVTDALRIQFLCDSQEGIDSSYVLNRAKELDILIIDRDIPLPNNFMNLVRTLGSKFNILQPIGTS